MERIPEQIDSKFRFVLLAATRCEQLMRGAAPKSARGSSKLTRIAMEEIIAEEIPWSYGPPPSDEVPDEENVEDVVEMIAGADEG